jgi:hypothetical protein
MTGAKLKRQMSIIRGRATGVGGVTKNESSDRLAVHANDKRDTTNNVT